jgi:hypothetical protein
MTRPGRLNELRVETGFDGHRATTSLFIDGVDILELQQPTVWPDGSSYRDGRPKVFRPADPTGLLPPDSRVLLPAAQPCPAMIGVCRRDGGQVLWEPDPDAPRHSVDRTWRFDLVRYLDAVDAGTSTMTWELRVPWASAGSAGVRLAAGNGRVRPPRCCSRIDIAGRGRYGPPVSRVNDVGGQTGFGEINTEDRELTFHADWEARVYALNTALLRRGIYNLDQFRDALEQMPPEEYLAASYYERWLAAIETLTGTRSARRP